MNGTPARCPDEMKTQKQETYTGLNYPGDVNHSYSRAYGNRLPGRTCAHRQRNFRKHAVLLQSGNISQYVYTSHGLILHFVFACLSSRKGAKTQCGKNVNVQSSAE